MCSNTSKLTTVANAPVAKRERRAVDLLNRQIPKQPAALVDHRGIDLDATRVVTLTPQQVEHPSLAAADLEERAGAGCETGLAQESKVGLVIPVVVAAFEPSLWCRLFDHRRNLPTAGFDS